jgi:hypothetical protein
MALLLSRILLKTPQILSTLLYALGYFPDIPPFGISLGILGCLSRHILLDILPQMYHAVTLLHSIVLQPATALGSKDNRMDQERTHGTSLGIRQGSLLYSILYILSHSFPSVVLQYSNHYYPVHTLTYAYNIQNSNWWMLKKTMTRFLGRCVSKGGKLRYPQKPSLCRWAWLTHA